MLGGVISYYSLLVADILLLYRVVMVSAMYCNDDVVLMTESQVRFLTFLRRVAKRIELAESINIFDHPLSLGAEVNYVSNNEAGIVRR